MWSFIWLQVRQIYLYLLLCGWSYCSCIEKWLKGSGERCPQCNYKAKKGDIRVIYSKSISVVDTTERDRALKVRK